jgi:hypothetical protein
LAFLHGDNEADDWSDDQYAGAMMAAHALQSISLDHEAKVEAGKQAQTIERRQQRRMRRKRRGR